MNIRAEVIVPKDLLFNPAKLARAIENTLDGVALNIKADFGVTTRTWKTRPAFYIRRARVGERTIYTDNEIYHYISGGTKPHPIRGRRGRLGFYSKGFRAKSRVRFIGSNKGAQASQDFRTPKEVTHPGIKAREYPEAIGEKWDKKVGPIFQRAIDAEVR